MRNYVIMLFSGQNDSSMEAIRFAEGRPECRLDLLFIENIGIRPSCGPPKGAAKLLAARHSVIKRLWSVDGRRLQHHYLSEMPADLALALGCGIICAACRAVRRTAIQHVAQSIGAQPATPTEIEVAKAGAGATPAGAAKAFPLLDPEKRCAMAHLHAHTAPIPDSIRQELSQWEMALMADGALALDEMLALRGYAL